jgi:hypothetical protein
MVLAQKKCKLETEESKNKFNKERALLQKCQHKNIVSILEIPSKSDEMYMEYIPSSLYDIIQAIKLKKRPNFTKNEVVSFRKFSENFS